MEKVKQLWTLAKANPKISIAAAVVIVLIISQQTRSFMINGIFKREYSCDLRTNQERVSL